MRHGDRHGGGPGPLRRPRLYEQLADHIAAFIEAQGLSPGDRLPPERSLASELGVSRATLSRALVALEVQGRVEVRHGDGAVVRDPSDSRPAVAPEAFAGYPSPDLLAARAAVMAGVARLAAAHPDAALRAALAGIDGVVKLDELWLGVRHLAGPGLLADLDEGLSAASPPQDVDGGALAALSGAVVEGDGEAASRACYGLFGDT